MSSVIRPGAPEDAPALTNLAKVAKAWWGYPAEWLSLWRESLTISASDLERHPSWVVEVMGELVGCCVLKVEEGEAWLEHLWVAPTSQRNGIGRLLVQTALEESAARAARSVMIEADPFAEAFYLAMGAERVGEKPAPMPGAPERVLPLLRLRSSAHG